MNTVCDIIIPIWNQPDYTRDCIEAIIRNTPTPYKLILVDNASDDETRSYLQGLKNRSSLNVEVIRNEENLGFVRAVNQGMSSSRSPYVAILNNDTIPAPGWLERMIDFAVAHKDVGLINPRCDGHLDTPIDEYAKSLEKYKGEYMEMNQCQGFAMLVKRELVDKIGHLDEAFGIGGYDDTDYSMRAHKAGYRSVAIYDSYVYHRLHASFDKAGNREEWVRRNQKIYYDKWGKHLRVGVLYSPEGADDKKISQLAAFAYGLAREWSWVHIWVNSKDDEVKIKKNIFDALKRCGYPPHQNIRVDCFNLPKILLDLTLTGKLVERIRKRMRDKRFDAIIDTGNSGMMVLEFVAKPLKVQMLNLSLDIISDSPEKAGRRIAQSIKENRGKR
ncbi:MAG: glycosyltransferase family 2 protein [Candidatus Omnitrophota bacterium]|jgi:GT2 family glycosyltransferase